MTTKVLYGGGVTENIPSDLFYTDEHNNLVFYREENQVYRTQRIKTVIRIINKDHWVEAEEIRR